MVGTLDTSKLLAQVVGEGFAAQRVARAGTALRDTSAYRCSVQEEVSVHVMLVGALLVNVGVEVEPTERPATCPSDVQ